MQHQSHSDAPGGRGALARILGRARRQILANRLAAGACVFAAAAGGAALAVFAADRFTVFPSAVRFVLSSAFVVCGTALFYVKVLAPLVRRPDKREAARTLEARFPQLGDFALSAAELAAAGRSRSSAPSEELVGLTVDEAVKRMRGVPDMRAASRRSLLRPAAAFAAAAACWAIAAAVAPGDLAVFFHRFVHPMSALRYPSRTRIVEVNAPSIMPLGGTFEAEALAEGVIPEEAVFAIDPADGASRKVIAPGSEGRYRLSLDSVRGDFRFHVEAGDAATADRAVKVVPRPEVVTLSAEVAYPGYTGVGAVTVAGGNITALAGSRAVLSCVLNKPVASAKMLFDDKSEVAGVLSQDRTAVTFAFDLLDKRTYHVGLLDDYGFAQGDAPSYYLTAQEDAVPSVALERPNRDLTVVPDAVVPLSASATDDYGLVTLALKYTVARGAVAQPEKTAILAEPQRGARGAEAAFSWSLAALGLAPGDEITYYVEALDNVPDEPQAGRSETRTAAVVSVAQKLLEIEQMNRQIQIGLQAMARKQQQAREGVAAAMGAEAVQ